MAKFDPLLLSKAFAIEAKNWLDEGDNEACKIALVIGNALNRYDDLLALEEGNDDPE